MRTLDAKTVTGLLSLLLFLLLASPGVRVARAGEADAHAAGPQCSAEAGRQGAAALGAALAEVRRQAAEGRLDPRDAVAAGEVVVLNGRGYNYGPAPSADPSLLVEELRRQR